MRNVVVGLDVHLKKTQGTIMSKKGKVIKQEKFPSTKNDLARFLGGVPKGTPVALEAMGFCWVWIEHLEQLGYTPLLANPLKVKTRAEDVKTDKKDSELLAHLTRADWLPTVYIPPAQLRWMRSVLRHRTFRKKYSTALKNRTWSEFRKRDLHPTINLGTQKGRKAARSYDITEISENMDILDAVEAQVSRIERALREQHRDNPTVQLLQTIPGIGLIAALTLYAEIGDMTRFQSPEQLAKYAGLVPRVSQTSDHTVRGREVRGNKRLKWILTEAAWLHVWRCPQGRLGKLYRAAWRRKGDNRKAIKIVARKLVNIIWAVWTYQKAFMLDTDNRQGKIPANVCGTDRFH